MSNQKSVNETEIVQLLDDLSDVSLSDLEEFDNDNMSFDSDESMDDGRVIVDRESDVEVEDPISEFDHPSSYDHPSGLITGLADYGVLPSSVGPISANDYFAAVSIL